jgi:hypothetical protein
VLAVFTPAAQAGQVTIDVSWAVSEYPSSQGSYSGVVRSATFAATGAVVPSVTFCPEEAPWGMRSNALLYFSSTGTMVPSEQVIYTGDVTASFDIPLTNPQEVRAGETVLACFQLRPVTPDCVVTGPYPYGVITAAVLTLEIEDLLPAENATWGAIKSLYRPEASHGMATRR